MSQFDRLSGYDLFERTQRLQCFFIQGRVDFDHSHCFAASFAAAEMKAADIHPALTQDRADAADHTRNIVIAGDQHVAVWCCLDMKTVDLGDTPFASLPAVPKERSR